MRKRFLSFFLALLLLSMVFTGCGTQNESTTDSSGNQVQTSYNVNPSDSGNDSTPSGEQDSFLEAMAEAGKSVPDYLGNGERIVYVNVMNRLSVDCDCDGSPAEPDIHDIGILASTDPVALDQACIDLIYAQKDGDGASLVRRIESRNGLHTLEYAEEIGLGSRHYSLVNIDE